MIVDWDYIESARLLGKTWDELAARAGLPSGDILRKRFKRAKARLEGRILTEPDPVRRTANPLSYEFPGKVKALYLPDTQVEAGVPLSHFKAAGRYAAAKEVDVIIHAGDWGNFDSVSTHETPLSKEGLRLTDDIEACTESLELFRAGLGGYDPDLQLLTLGNHEDRVQRYIAERPELEGSLKLPPWEKYGWTVYPFLQPVRVNGVYFAHYFTRTSKGWAGTRPHPNAQTMTRREMVSCVAGHTPGLDPYIHPAGGGAGLIRGLIAGSFYQHDEAWMGPQGNRYWRGCLVLHELEGGYYNLMEVSMDYLLAKYGD